VHPIPGSDLLAFFKKETQVTGRNISGECHPAAIDV
jgi:hypothetical protein